MGYYATAHTENFLIKTENFAAALESGKELNARHDLKTGGSGMYRQNLHGRSVVNDDGGRGTPDKWFAWVEWNYDMLVDTLPELFEAFRFEDVEVDECGEGLLGFRFDSKIGGEEHLLRALAPFIEDGSEVVWEGEEGEMWKWTFNGGEMLTWHAEVSINWV